MIPWTKDPGCLVQGRETRNQQIYSFGQKSISVFTKCGTYFEPVPTLKFTAAQIKTINSFYDHFPETLYTYLWQSRVENHHSSNIFSLKPLIPGQPETVILNDQLLFIVQIRVCLTFLFHNTFKLPIIDVKKLNRKVQGVPKSQTVANPDT